jgi:hypothetical protein
MALRDRQYHLRRLLQRQLWEGETPRTILDQIELQLLATKATLIELQQLIADKRARSKD